MSFYKICFIIPVYNHHQFIEDTLFKIQPYCNKIFLINDGSKEECQFILEAIAKRDPNLVHICLPYNQGKGAAVINGLELAFEQGFTHALQFDADGQHNHLDIPKMLEYSKENPDDVVSGQAIYDKSIPKVRFYCRYISHFWVWVETLSFDIKDSMCGFRIYPLDSTVALIKKISIGQRMDFDTDILVRLHWQGVRVKFIKTRVTYPLDGISHFKIIIDNWKITIMHIKLFFLMLKQLPLLIRRKF